MTADLGFLEETISDVGLWSWWTADLPKGIQIEFTGTLLWNPSLKEGSPPNGQIALWFSNPSFVGFLTRQARTKLPKDWPEKLQNDQMEPLNLSPDEFTLSDAKRLSEMVAESSRVQTLFGTTPILTSLPAEAGMLGFWAGSTGLVIAAKDMKIYGYAGPLSVEEAEASNRK